MTLELIIGGLSENEREEPLDGFGVQTDTALEEARRRVTESVFETDQLTPKPGYDTLASGCYRKRPAPGCK